MLSIGDVTECRLIFSIMLNSPQRCREQPSNEVCQISVTVCKRFEDQYFIVSLDSQNSYEWQWHIERSGFYSALTGKLRTWCHKGEESHSDTNYAWRIELLNTTLINNTSNTIALSCRMFISTATPLTSSQHSRTVQIWTDICHNWWINQVLTVCVLQLWAAAPTQFSCHSFLLSISCNHTPSITHPLHLLLIL